MDDLVNKSGNLVNDLVNDTISRTAAIDAFAPYAEYDSNRTNAEWVRRINMVLSALPSAQPGWIPWDKDTRNSMVFTLRSVLNGGDMDAIDEDNIKRLLRWLEGGEL